MNYSRDKFFACLDRVLTEEGFAKAPVPVAQTAQIPSGWESQLLSSKYKDAKNKPDEYDRKLTVLKARTPSPLGIWTLAQYSPNMGIPHFVSNFEDAVSTVTIKGAGIVQKMNSILARVAGHMDDEHKNEIETDYNVLHQNFASMNTDGHEFFSYIPFYKLIGLNGTGFKVFDIHDQQDINTPEKDDEFTLTIGDFPILFKDKRKAPIHFKDLFSAHVKIQSFENSWKESLPFQLFLNNFNIYGAEKPINELLRDDAILSKANAFEIANSDPLFSSVLTTDPHGNAEEYYLPKAVTNIGGGFNLSHRADPQKDIRFFYFSETEFQDIPEALDIGHLQFKKISSDAAELLESTRKLCLSGKLTSDNSKNLVDHAYLLNNKCNTFPFFKPSTRIRRFEIDKTVIYYAKNSNTCNRRNKPIEDPLQSFPSSLYKDVKTLLDLFPHLLRQKRKKEENPQKALPLLRLGTKRIRKNLGSDIKKNLSFYKNWEIEGDTANQVVKKAFEDTDATNFYKSYREMCNPFTEKEVTAPRADQEWCHLIAHKDSLGDDSPENLVAGSYHANTEQCAIEGAIRASKFYDKIRLKLTAYLVPCSPAHKNLDPLDHWDEYLQDTIIMSRVLARKTTEKLTPQELYNLLAHGSSIQKEDDQKVFIEKITNELKSAKINTCAAYLNEYYGFQDGLKTEGTSHDMRPKDKRIRNALRHLFDTLSLRYYSPLPVAAFIRYRIFVENTRMVDYTVDAMRDEFDINEYRLTQRWVHLKLESYRAPIISIREPDPEPKMERGRTKRNGLNTKRSFSKDESRSREKIIERARQTKAKFSTSRERTKEDVRKRKDEDR